MKILLLGEFSALYSNLKDGLTSLGCDVTHASAGDGWKKIPSDIDLGSGVDRFSFIKRKLYPIIKSKNLTGYNVAQYINPFQINFGLNFFNRCFFSYLIENNESFFLTAGGDDAFYWRGAREKLRYGPFEDILKYDLKSKVHRSEKKSSRIFNEWILEASDGIIPNMYDYELAYKESGKLKKTIPIPVNLDKIPFADNKVRKRLTVFHGLNRPGFKGTRHIAKAFDYLNKKYPDQIECIIDGKMPLNDYLDVMSRVNVVVDQTSTYSLGVNGVYALAMGKIVLGGAEPESLESFKISSSPVVNITPSPEDIISKIEALLDADTQYLGRLSRDFCEKVHGHINVAEQYLDVWNASRD